MPDPKKKNTSAPKNAQTDTGTGGAKKMMKKATPTAQKKATPIARQTTTTGGGKGVQRTGGSDGYNYRKYGGSANTSAYTGDPQASAADTYAHEYDYTSHDNMVSGKEHEFHSLLASGGSGGRVGRSTAHGGSGRRVGKTSDPFVEGFNSTDTSLTKRSGRRRKS